MIILLLAVRYLSQETHDEASFCSPSAKLAGLLTIMITESPLRNILLTYLSLFTAFPLVFPLPPLDVSVHISFTSSKSLVKQEREKIEWESRVYMISFQVGIDKRSGKKVLLRRLISHNETYKFICRSYAFTLPRSLWLFRTFTSTWVLFLTAW